MAADGSSIGQTLHCHSRDADARLKLFLFPHAGGGQHSFNALAAQFGEVAQAVSGVSGLAELHTVLYPGPCVRSSLKSFELVPRRPAFTTATATSNQR